MCILCFWQIVAVIMCNTGVALLAYMDGIAKTPTLGSVVMAATGAAGSAAYKVRLQSIQIEPARIYMQNLPVAEQSFVLEVLFVHWVTCPVPQLSSFSWVYIEFCFCTWSELSQSSVVQLELVNTMRWGIIK